MKKIILFLFAVLVFPMIFAINLEVTQLSENVFVVGSNQNIVVDLLIKNNDPTSQFQAYNLLGFDMNNTDKFSLNKGEQKQISFTLIPREKMDMRGFYMLEYFIRDQKDSKSSYSIKIKVIEPKDAFEVGAEDISLDENSIKLYIENKENYSFENLTVRFTSDLFSLDKSLSFRPLEKKTFEIELNSEDIKKLVAGFYTINTEVEALGQKGVVEGKVRLVEKDLLETTNEYEGILIRKQIIEKTNNGNTILKPEVVVERSIFTRFFTLNSPKASLVEIEGTTVKYHWVNEINPGEKEVITISTNWFFPIILAGLIALIIYLIVKFARTDVVINKKVTSVRTKGGEFALRITLFVKAQNYIERLNLIERLPALVKVYPKFGGEQPIKVDEEKRKIAWTFEKMEAGEIRKITYVLYSKVGVLGRFVLPKTRAVYERNGEIKKSYSNKSFFASRKDSQQ